MENNTEDDEQDVGDEDDDLIFPSRPRVMQVLLERVECALLKGEIATCHSDYELKRDDNQLEKHPRLKH